MFSPITSRQAFRQPRCRRHPKPKRLQTVQGDNPIWTVPRSGNGGVAEVDTRCQNVKQWQQVLRASHKMRPSAAESYWTVQIAMDCPESSRSKAPVYVKGLAQVALIFFHLNPAALIIKQSLFVAFRYMQGILRYTKLEKRLKGATSRSV